MQIVLPPGNQHPVLRPAGHGIRLFPERRLRIKLVVRPEHGPEIILHRGEGNPLTLLIHTGQQLSLPVHQLPQAVAERQPFGTHKLA